eukprot:CAMPEP_0170483428 /NCGR_PEP_ID=MMETSP0208-20121228/3095_1 /TAXON_ID=197538 /ORGANISM="Strombidium inclinatum, Strain S3" /LENGTH=47 /DNA_ID= /DNA_START= /DNA_END= /DNA_ORIENTATION=
MKKLAAKPKKVDETKKKKNKSVLSKTITDKKRAMARELKQMKSQREF